MGGKLYLNEAWKPVIYKNIKEGDKYEVSNYGRIRYFNRNLNVWQVKNNTIIHGYPYYTWFKTNRGWKYNTSKCVHKLVAIAFCHRPNEEHKFVIHLNFEKADNHFKNLKWVTPEELRLHKRKNPYVQDALHNKSQKNKSFKLTETEVIRLKMKLKRSKNPFYKIAKEFGISHTQLKRIRRGENWGHVKID